MTSENNPLRHAARHFQQTRPATSIERWAIPCLVLAFVVFYLLPLMTHGLWIPDETRYGQISQEMLLSGNWVAPHFMGIPVSG